MDLVEHTKLLFSVQNCYRPSGNCLMSPRLLLILSISTIQGLTGIKGLEKKNKFKIIKKKFVAWEQFPGAHRELFPQSPWSINIYHDSPGEGCSMLLFFFK